MKLKTLTIRAFKGVQEFTLNAGGHDVDIFAANGVGKSSTADAFSWLLFGRDSLGRADFGIVPTDANGLVIEGASPTVTAEIEIAGGETITLQRGLVQKKQSVRGAAPTAAGTTTDFSIDGVPVKKTEYTNRIAEIADETLFPLLTDPRAFCGTLHWQKRRDVLLRLFGGATDADIIAGEPDLANLPAVLGKRSIDDHRRMLAPKLADLKKQLAAIPARIDEVKRGIPPAPDGDPAADLAALREGRSWTQANLERIENGGESADLRRQLAEINARIIDAETEAKRADAERLAGLVGARRAAREQLTEREALLHDVERKIDNVSDEISRLTAEAAALATLAQRAASRPPPDVGFDDSCPSCGQELPADQLRAVVDAAMAQYNRDRSETLESLAGRAAIVTQQIAEAESEREKLGLQAGEVSGSIDGAFDALNAAEAAVEAFVPVHPDDADLWEERYALEGKISALDNGNAAALATTREALDQIDAQIAAAEAAMADARAREQAECRIATLTAERRALAHDLDTVECEIALCDLFTRRKIEQTTEAINSRFGGLTWKLFDTQVNGEVADCCEATVNGVPWRDLSNSQQINAGLGVIDVIGQHYGVTPPIFIDNAESVSTIRPTTAQQIRLIVSAAHKQLTVEVAK